MSSSRTALDWFPAAASAFLSTRVRPPPRPRPTSRRTLVASPRPIGTPCSSSTGTSINQATLTPLAAQKVINGITGQAQSGGVCLAWYLGRLVQYGGFSECSLVASLALIDRVVDRNLEFAVTDSNVHTLLLASVLVASKFYEDEFYPNSYYARVGGVTPDEMNELEIAFLVLVRFDLLISKPLYDVYLCALQPPRERISSCRPTVAPPRLQYAPPEFSSASKGGTAQDENGICTDTPPTDKQAQKPELLEKMAPNKGLINGTTMSSNKEATAPKFPELESEANSTNTPPPERELTHTTTLTQT
ncbi:Cyclin [Pelomyxa schiedti]|nr:Cyclin [Pelomyxa schiedti]